MSIATRQLGHGGPFVSAISLGCMGMSDFYGPADRIESIATITAALDAGVTMLDTGDFYGMGDNEMLVRDALAGRPRDSVQIAVKFGALRGPDASWLGFDGRPAAVKNALAYSLKRLGTDYVDIYMPSRLDPDVPIEETVGAVADMVAAGYVRHIGLSEVGSATLRRAQATHPIAALQIEYSLMSRGIEADILPTARELGIGITAYGVLAKGMIAGSAVTETGDFRGHSPRFQGENLARNQSLVDELAKVATDLGHTPAQVAIAWVLSRGTDIVPLVGARRRDRLQESLGALDIGLSPDQLARIEAAMPAHAVAGERYPAFAMANLDSEKVAA